MTTFPLPVFGAATSGGIVDSAPLRPVHLPMPGHRPLRWWSTWRLDLSLLVGFSLNRAAVGQLKLVGQLKFLPTSIAGVRPLNGASFRCWPAN